MDVSTLLTDSHPVDFCVAQREERTRQLRLYGRPSDVADMRDFLVKIVNNFCMSTYGKERYVNHIEIPESKDKIYSGIIAKTKIVETDVVIEVIERTAGMMYGYTDVVLYTFWIQPVLGIVPECTLAPPDAQTPASKPFARRTPSLAKNHLLGVTKTDAQDQILKEIQERLAAIRCQSMGPVKKQATHQPDGAEDQEWNE
jgi:hypothetical protein